MQKQPITIQATIAKPATQVWEYYTEPKHIVNWNFASDDWCCPSAENDLQPGGTYKARMEAKDGSMGFDFEAVYKEVVPEERFIYQLADGRIVQVNFDQGDAGTEVTVIFDAEDQNPRDMQQAGWQAILDNFKRYVERST